MAQGAGGMQSWMLVLALLPAGQPVAEPVEQALPGFEYIEHRMHYDLDARTLYALRIQLEERRREMGAGPEPVGRTTQRLEVRYELSPHPERDQSYDRRTDHVVRQGRPRRAPGPVL